MIKYETISYQNNITFKEQWTPSSDKFTWTWAVWNFNKKSWPFFSF